jgi:hypothetical protein
LWRKPEYLEKTTNLPQAQHAMSGIPTLVGQAHFDRITEEEVMAYIDVSISCIYRCKYYYHQLIIVVIVW